MEKVSGKGAKSKSTSDSGLSPTTFLFGCLGVFSAGSVAGVIYAAKNEPNTHSFRTNPAPVYVAMRAFTLGTVLCIGSVTTVVSASALALGVRSFGDLRELAEITFQNEEVRRERANLLKKELKELKGLSVSEEIDYFSKYFSDEPTKSDISVNENHQNDATSK